MGGTPLPKPCLKKRKTVEETTIARQSKVTTRPRRKPSKLAELPTMPIDILFEIFRYLMPHDLLRLTRTNKDFRGLLLNKNSTSVWKDILGNVAGLPECPPEMSEPAWVNLLFSSYCQFCSTTTKSVEWQFRVRMCQKCAKEQLEYLWNSHDLPSKDPVNAFGQLEWQTVVSLIPNRFDSKGEQLYMLPVYRTVEREYNALEGEEARKTYIEERTESVKAIRKHARRCLTWEIEQSENRGADLRRLKNERKAAIVQKLKELGWGQDIQSVRYPDSLANHKLVNRPQRLTDKVWTNIKDEILVFMQQMRNKRLGREFSDLVKTRKLVAMDVLRAFKKARITDNELMPGPPDFCELEVVKGILNKPVHEEVDMSTFDPIIASLPASIEQWRRTVDEEMSRCLKNVYNPFIQRDGQDQDKAMINKVLLQSEEEAVEKMKLASNVFMCRGCKSLDRAAFPPWFCSMYAPRAPKELLFYPQLLGHRCLSFEKPYGDFGHLSRHVDMPDPSLNLRNSALNPEPGGASGAKRKAWSDGTIYYDYDGGKAAEAIIKLAGPNPGVATTSDMDQLNLRFLCRSCSHKEAKADQTKQVKLNNDKDDEQPKAPNVIALYEWRAAIRHAVDTPHEIKGNTFIVVRAEELSSDIRTAEVALREKTTHEWGCMHCLDTQDEETALYKLDAVKEHISDSHKIMSPILNEDYFLHFTSPDMRTIQRPLWLHIMDGQLSVIPPEVGINYDKYPTERPSLKNIDSYDGRWSDKDPRMQLDYY